MESPPKNAEEAETKASEARTELPKEDPLPPKKFVQDPEEKRKRRKREQAKTHPQKGQRVYPPNLISRTPGTRLREPKVARRGEQDDLRRRRRHWKNILKTERFRDHSKGRYFPLERKSATKILFSWNVSRLKEDYPLKTPFPQVQGQPTQGRGVIPALTIDEGHYGQID